MVRLQQVALVSSAVRLHVPTDGVRRHPAPEPAQPRTSRPARMRESRPTGQPMRPMRMHTQRGPVRSVRTGAAIAVAHSAAVGKDLEGFEAVHVQQVQHAAAGAAAYAPRRCDGAAPRTHPPAVLVHALCTHPAGIWRGRARTSGKGREGTGTDGCVPGLCWRRIAKSELLGCQELEGQWLKPERNTLARAQAWVCWPKAYAHEPFEKARVHELRKVVGRTLRLERFQLHTTRPAPTAQTTDFRVAYASAWRCGCLPPALDRCELARGAVELLRRRRVPCARRQ
jgi:hypothetical protein